MQVQDLNIQSHSIVLTSKDSHTIALDLERLRECNPTNLMGLNPGAGTSTNLFPESATSCGTHAVIVQGLSMSATHLDFRKIELLA